MRHALLYLPGLALALAALAGCNRTEEPAAAEPVRPVRAMQVAAVETPSLLLTGTIEPRVRTDLGFRVLGRITSRPVETGDTVQQGAVLATVDPTTLDLAVQSAEADLISAKAQLAEASGVAFRQSELLAARASTQASFESADRQRRTGAAQVASAQARLTKAQEQRGYAELKADYDGVVLSTSADVGQVVSPGQTVLTLARPDVREAVIDVPDQAASSLAVGMPFNVRLELDHGMTTSGRVREIAPSADPATRSRRVRITLDDPPQDFRLGSTVRVFPADEGPPGIALPASAVKRTADGDFVFVIEDGTRAVLRAVELEPVGPGFKVTSGLSDGETVATAGVNRLEDGQAVRIGGDAI